MSFSRDYFPKLMFWFSNHLNPLSHHISQYPCSSHISIFFNPWTTMKWATWSNVYYFTNFPCMKILSRCPVLSRLYFICMWYSPLLVHSRPCLWRIMLYSFVTCLLAFVNQVTSFSYCLCDPFQFAWPSRLLDYWSLHYNWVTLD